ncbi:hypothetical protein D918_03034 [Trichuris suis]|nr:hypothetical protein D918_03034 [Trichuris suis]
MVDSFVKHDIFRRLRKKPLMTIGNMRKKPRQYSHMRVTVLVKCAGKRDPPYGIAIIEAKGEKCTCEIKMKCYCYRRIPSVNATVQCQYAARISDKNTKGENFLGLMCYEKRSELPEKIMDPRVMCEKWRYPGLEYPRLQVPDYLKSTDARPVVYNPPQVEDRKFSCRYCDSWPKNQKERTGFGGIGDLNNLGPNHVLYLIVTSGPANDSEIILIGNGENATLPKACYLSEGSQVDYYFMGDRVKALSKEIGGCPQSELWHVVKGLKEVC